MNEAITTVVNGYGQCELTKVWGLGKSASGDGTKWDLSPQNLMSEYHIRYGGYGGIGYYLVSDLYIGPVQPFHYVWVVGGTLHPGLHPRKHIRRSARYNPRRYAGPECCDIRSRASAGHPTPPRIRNWKNLHFFRPDPQVRYKHIDLLFTKQVEWGLIETMLPEMLRVAISIGAGRIRPSTILRRLATYSRKNKLYFAFRELGRVVRPAFLLDYISDIELRRTIQAATNKSEAFNLFVQWVAFGGGRLLAENTRDEQRKMIKYHHLAANLLIFHNVVTMTRALQLLIADGHQIDEEALACLSPYQTEHINRFGRYTLKRDRIPEPLERVRVLRMPPRSEGLPAEKIKKSVTI